MFTCNAYVNFTHLYIQSAAMGSLFLAAKVEEVPRRATDVVNVFYRLDQIRRGERPEIEDWAALVRTFTSPYIGLHHRLITF